MFLILVYYTNVSKVQIGNKEPVPGSRFPVPDSEFHINICSFDTNLTVFMIVYVKENGIPLLAFLL